MGRRSGRPNSWQRHTLQERLKAEAPETMSIPEHFIQRPIATILVMVAILVFGLAGYHALPVSDLPNVDYPTINVNANLPGANPDTPGPQALTRYSF